MDQAQLDSTVARLRRQGTDDATTEVKSSEKALGKGVWDSVSAFANTSGGVIIFGLAESSGFAPVAAFDLDRVRDQFVEGIGDGSPAGARLTNPPSYQLSRLESAGHPVLVAEIDENAAGTKPCFVTAKGLAGGSFKRVEDKDIKLSPTEIFEYQHVLTHHGADRRTVDECSIEDLDNALVDALIEVNRHSKALRGVTTRQEALTRLNVTDRGEAVRLAGLLVLGRFPQQFFPRLLVDVTVHPTNEKSSPSSQLRFVDRVECQGPLAEVVDEAVNAIARNLRTYSVVEGVGRSDQLEIPREVLREAVANAVLHREYHEMFCGQPVAVDIYPDRITITNPGGLWGGKTVDSLDDGVSRCRNQTLLQLLRQVPTAAGGGMTVEGQGSGIRLMINQMEAHALERPLFTAAPDQVTVELRRHGAEIPEHRKWLRSVIGRDLTPHEDAALALARRRGHVTVSMLQRSLRIDSDEARALLRRLHGEGVLRLRGPEDYEISDGGGPSRGDLDVLDVLSGSEPLDIHAIAEATGRKPGALRPILRRLVAAGSVRATAPPTSRHRRYLRVE